MRKRLYLLLAIGLAMWALLSVEARAGNEAAELAFERGLAALQDSQWGEALSYFDQAIAANPNNANALHYRGATLLKLKQPEEAVKSLEKSRDLDPNAPDIYLDLGTAYMNMGRTDDALKAFREEVRRNPESADAQFSLGYLLVVRKEYQAALGPLAKARALDPKLAAPARFYEATALFGMNKREDAKAAFKDVLGLNPSSEMAATSRKYIEVIEGGGGAAKRWGLVITSLYQYDTNVIAVSDQTDIPTTIDNKQISRKDDSRAVLNIYGRWQFLSADPWTAEARYSFYQSYHWVLHSFNLQNHSPEIMVGRKFSIGGHESAISLDYRGSVALLGEKLPWYSVNHIVTPTLAVKWSRNFSTAFSYRATYEDLKSSKPDLDNVTHGGFIDAYLNFLSDRATLSGSFGYDYSDAKDKDYDLKRPWASLGLDLTLPWKVKTRLKAHYQNDNHYRTSSPDRSEDIFTAEFLLFRPIWGPIEANINANYRLNNSTEETYEYERTIVGGGVVVRF